MTKIVKVTCDGCQSDITSTPYGLDYRLVLSQETIPTNGSHVKLNMRHPLIASDKHFCCIQCIDKWLSPTPETVATALQTKVC